MTSKKDSSQFLSAWRGEVPVDGYFAKTPIGGCSSRQKLSRPLLVTPPIIGPCTTSTLQEG